MAATKGYAINSPQIHCLAVDSVGDVTVTWSLPSNLDATFIAYDIYTSATKAGPYTLSATVPLSAQTSTTINGLGANSAPVYVYIVTDTNGTPPATSVPIDTMETIYLDLNNKGTGIAYLSWNAMCSPNLPSSSGWYKIYREYPKYVWTLVDSTKNLAYNDTIYICSASLTYKVEIADNSGCTSVSSIPPPSTFVNLTVPEMPYLDTVSVDIGTNGVYISWTRSSTPDVIGYIIYKYIHGIRTPIDTVYGIDSLHYYDNSTAAGGGSQSYWIAAIDGCNNTSPYDSVQNTLYLTQTPDSCLHNNTLAWNAFVHMLPEVAHYKIYRSVNAGPFALLAQTNNHTLTYVDNAVTVPAQYCYYVVAVDSIHAFTASSNEICYKVNIYPTAKFSYLQTATVVANSYIAVQAYVDTAAHASFYLLQRANSVGGTYTNIGTVSSTLPYIGFTDNTANPNQQSYVYQVISQNECGYDMDTTQIGETMYLTALGNGDGVNTLTWNDYTKWQKGVAAYNIYRNEDDGAFSLVASVPYTAAGTNTYYDDVSSILQGQGIFGYYIQAVEKPPTYPFVDTSYSNIAIAYQDPRMYIPNAFDPKGRNNIFIPIGVFVDLQNYDFQIFDRWGQLIFETHDYTQGWNGTYGGSIAAEGVYVYRIIYTSSKGEFFERKGTVTLLK